MASALEGEENPWLTQPQQLVGLSRAVRQIQKALPIR